jgi:putative MFS transporter
MTDLTGPKPAMLAIPDLETPGLRRLHLMVLAICTLGFFFDVAEISIGGALSAVFSSAPYSASPIDLSWLLASMYIGAVIGAPLLGWLADRHGRRIVIASALVFLAIVSIGAAFARDIHELTIMRGISGITIGAYPPLVIAYLTDILPAKRRGMFILIMSGLAFLGAIGISFFIRGNTAVPPLGFEAWRWAFCIAGAGAAFAGLCFTWLPESPQWLLTRRPNDEAIARRRFENSPAVTLPFERVVVEPERSVAAVTGSGRTRRAPGSPLKRAAVLAIMFFLSPWSTVAFPLLTGAILVERGFSLNDALFYVALATFGPVIASIATAFFIDRFDRRIAMSAFAVAMAASGMIFILGTTPILLMVGTIGFSLFASLYIPVLSIYAAEIFETGLRARATTGSWAVNRVGSAIAPFVLLPLLHSFGATAMFLVILAALAAGVALILVAGETNTQR